MEVLTIMIKLFSLTNIEKRHPDFDGLNLTWESLEGIVKHNGIILKNPPFHTALYNKT